MKCIFITGASTGIGLATASYFAEKGWKVIATMRDISKAPAALKHPHITLQQLDVTKPGTVIQDHFPIDVLVNNAGYAVAGAFEATADEQIRKQFETNVFGVMNMTRAILPHFRERKGGTIINVTSSGGIITFPLYSAYNSTKWAIEGFMESLQFELKQFNIKVINIEPAAVRSAFTDNVQFISHPVYDAYGDKVQRNTLKGYKNAPSGDVVAKVIYKAATDNRFRMRYAGTSQAKLLFFLRWLLPLRLFNKIISGTMEKE